MSQKTLVIIVYLLIGSWYFSRQETTAS